MINFNVCGDVSLNIKCYFEYNGRQKNFIKYVYSHRVCWKNKIIYQHNTTSVRNTR